MKRNARKMRCAILSIVAIGLAALFATGCSSGSKVADSPHSQTNELNGEIFVVSKGGSNIKIGLGDIEIQNQQTKEVYKTNSNADGRFTFSAPAGSYILTATAIRTYEMKYRGPDSDILEEQRIDKSLSDVYKKYLLAINYEQIKVLIQLNEGGLPRNRAVDNAFVRIVEYCNWKIPVNLNQPIQSVQLSNNNLADFGVKNEASDNKPSRKK